MLNVTKRFFSTVYPPPTQKKKKSVKWQKSWQKLQAIEFIDVNLLGSGTGPSSSINIIKVAFRYICIFCNLFHSIFPFKRKRALEKSVATPLVNA